MTQQTGLPADLLEWIGALTGGTVSRYRRHAARREAWQIDINHPRGGQRYFLRIDRDLARGRGSSRHLRRETALIQALNAHNIPSQTILGWNETHAAALQSWLPGSGRLDTAAAELRHRVMMEFMEVLAHLHRIDITALDLPEFVYPGTAVEHSLLEIDAIDEPGLHPRSACTVNPLAAFGKRWLINNAPTDIQATVLLQGDTGPGNFMYDSSGVTGLMDWEWGHYGDPMEDLGNIWLRDFFMPSCNGDLSPYFEHYAKCSGFRLNYDSIIYYRIHQLLRSVIGLHYTTRHMDWQTTLYLNLGYRAVIDLELCAAIAQAAGKPVRTVEPLPEAIAEDSIQEILALQVERLIIPQLADPFTEDLARGHAATLRYLDLQARWQAEFNAQELEDLRQLLGGGIADLDTGRRQLLEAIPSLNPAEEGAVLDVLYGAAVNQARLMRPLTALWDQCRWAAIE